MRAAPGAPIAALDRGMAFDDDPCLRIRKAAKPERSVHELYRRLAISPQIIKC